MAAKKPRRRERTRAPEAEYRDDQGNVLALRGSMTIGTRREYAATVAGSPLSRDDAWQRAVEFLFERLAVRWEIAGLPLEGQAELLGRYRMADPELRRWVRRTLVAHVSERLPELGPL